MADNEAIKDKAIGVCIYGCGPFTLEGWREHTKWHDEQIEGAAVMGGATLLARCENVNEDSANRCLGMLTFRWGMSQAACDKCGAWRGIAVADWTEVQR